MKVWIRVGTWIPIINSNNIAKSKTSCICIESNRVPICTKPTNILIDKPSSRRLVKLLSNAIPNWLIPPIIGEINRIEIRIYSCRRFTIWNTFNGFDKRNGLKSSIFIQGDSLWTILRECKVTTCHKITFLSCWDIKLI